MIVDKLVGDSIKSIFQSERDRLRNADDPHLMRPKNNRKPLKGIARILYLEGKAKLSKAETIAGSGLGLSLMKRHEANVKKEKDDEILKKKKDSSTIGDYK